MKNFVFYFLFYDENTEKQTTYGFTIPGFNKTTDEIINTEWFENALDNISSKYGVHDWSSSPNHKVEAVGYTSYEIDKINYMNVMNDWRNIFVKENPDAVVTKIVKIIYNNNDDDLSIYNKYSLKKTK